jgi:hypothetical protein
VRGPAWGGRAGWEGRCVNRGLSSNDRKPGVGAKLLARVAALSGVDVETARRLLR